MRVGLLSANQRVLVWVIAGVGTLDLLSDAVVAALEGDFREAVARMLAATLAFLSALFIEKAKGEVDP